MSGGVIVGVDVGGTFTDVFAIDRASGRATVAKLPTTADNQAEGFAEGVRRGAGGGGIAGVLHGTTVGTNALLQRRGGRVGMIVTAGFRDVLEMRRRDRPETWGLRGSYQPVVARDFSVEIAERTLADGTIRQAVDPGEVRLAAEHLLAKQAEALVIFFVNSYANAANEQAALAAVRAVWPNDFVMASSDILPEIREFERASTAALNAYLQPVLGHYLARLDGALAGDGLAGEVLIHQSNGGVMNAATARRLPVRTALSGPAAGVMAGGEIARAAGYENVITCDMGGTSFDVSLIAEGKPALSAQTSIDFGLVIRTPMVEITTIGAGGGSIAWVDGGGLLRVGPQSAGSEPGPVCYGLGNDRPTVTDANVVLGRINAARPIGGKLDRLDASAAEAAILEHVGRPLGLDAVEAAAAIIRVANGLMAGAIRLVSIERGHDPRSFAAMPFGGGGALHAGALLNEVGLAKAIVPRYPGVVSALGCALADLRDDAVATVNRNLEDIGPDGLADRLAALRHGCTTLVGPEAEFSLAADMSYQGQSHTVAVPLAEQALGDSSALRRAFEARYREVYGRLLTGIPIRLLNLRLTAVVRREAFDLLVLAPPADADMKDAARGARPVWCDGGWREAPIYDRLCLPVGAIVPGPAILEQPDATIYVDPGLIGEVDMYGNLIMARIDD
jgi:N-methylhydantoinase A